MVDLSSDLASDLDLSTNNVNIINSNSSSRKSSPLLDLVYPRCLLAGSKACPMTLTCAGEGLYGSSQTVKVYARHKGRFLGSGTDDNFLSFKACATIATSTMSSTTNDESIDGAAYILFSLDAPSSPGLVCFEYDVGGAMSNWKPVSGGIETIMIPTCPCAH